MMLLAKLHAKKDEIESLASHYGAKDIRVFGSVARQEETVDSDIDFLVDFPQGYDLFSQRLPLTNRLAKLTGRKVDLIPEHELNPHIRSYVIAEALSL